MTKVTGIGSSGHRAIGSARQCCIGPSPERVQRRIIFSSVKERGKGAWFPRIFPLAKRLRLRCVPGVVGCQGGMEPDSI
jgi:hypothetical protein